MTREEALKRVAGYLTDLFLPEEFDEVEEIMSALKQEPCDDAISRQAVLDLVNADWEYDGLESDIVNLPPVTPTHKKGKWIMTSDYLTTAYGSVNYIKCSCCDEDSLEEGDFCPNCGAEMEVE